MSKSSMVQCKNLEQEIITFCDIGLTSPVALKQSLNL